MDRENQEETMILSIDLEPGNHGGARTSTMSQKHNLPFCKVLTQVLVIDDLPFPTKYFRQFPRKDVPAKNKASIKEGVKAEDILERILEEEMKVTPKELWAVVPKLYMALKEILMSKHSAKENPNMVLETEES